MMLRVYRALIHLLPRHVRERDGEEMLGALRDQMADAREPHAAGWRALIRFPGVLALEWRDVLLKGAAPLPPVPPRGGQMDSLGRALRQCARSLVRTPAFSLSVILLLGAGVGSVSAIFAVVDHVLLRALPYPDADRIVVVEGGPHSIPALEDMQAMRSVEAWAAASVGEARMNGRGDPLSVRQALLTPGFFPLFGARAAVGRLLQSDDAQAANTAVLSHATWVRVFGADTSAVGSTVRIDDIPVTIVGVLDERFALPDGMVGAHVDVWQPVDRAAEYASKRDYWMFNVAGRLHPDATLAEAQREASRVASERAAAFPRYVEGGRVLELPVRPLRDATVGSVERPLLLLLGAVSLLLLVTCASAMHLFLARGVERMREIAIRRALGAGSRSLVAQLFIEACALGVAGAVLGAFIAHAGLRAFLALAPAGLPRGASVNVDARVLLFTACISILAAILFGLLPALRLAGRGSSDLLRASRRTLTASLGAQRLRGALVIGEVALSLVLIAQAGWLLRSFIRMSSADLGFRAAGVVEIPLSIPMSPRVGGDAGERPAAEWHRRMQALRESVAQVGGVGGVTFGLTMPLEHTGGGRCCWSTRPSFAGTERQQRTVVTHPVSEDYFAVFDIPLIAGAPWAREATLGAPYPAVLSEQLASEVYGAANAALGQRFTLDRMDFHIVGVARNTRHYGVDQPYAAAVYVPAALIPFPVPNGTLAVRSERADETFATELRAAIWRVEPGIPVPTITAVAQLARQDASQRRLDAALVTTFSVVALLLAAGGLAGTLLYMISLQRRSLGIRLALGATPRGLELFVLTNGVRLAAVGAVIGTISAWFVGRLIESRLFGVEARDALTLALAVSLLMLVALLSSWIPARRAAGIDPMESLRAE